MLTLNHFSLRNLEFLFVYFSCCALLYQLEFPSSNDTDQGYEDDYETFDDDQNTLNFVGEMRKEKIIVGEKNTHFQSGV